MVKLLIFAHRGEAQAFFNEWELLPVSFFFHGIIQKQRSLPVNHGRRSKRSQ